MTRLSLLLFGVAALVLCASLSPSSSSSSSSSPFVAGSALTCPAAAAPPPSRSSFSSLHYRPSDCSVAVQWTGSANAAAASSIAWPHPNPAMCSTCVCPVNEQCSYSGGFCSENIVGRVSPLLPISLGTAGGNASFSVATSQQARSVFRGSMCPGACHPFDQLLLQLFTAKLNLASGCTGSATATIAPTIAAVDSFLAAHSWAWLPAERTSFPAGYLLDVRRWTRLLRTFNIAASPHGSCSAETIRDAELSNSGSSILLAQWNATAGLCGVPTACADSTACAEAALSDEREHRFHPVCCDFVPPEPRVVGTAIPPYAPYIRIATSPKLDWPKLAYTPRDWERWDGFDYQSDFIAPASPAVEPVTQISEANALFSPMVSASATATPTALANPPASAAFVRDWTAELRGVLHRTFFSSAYENWRAMNTLTARPLLSDLFGPQAALYYFDPRLIHHNMSFSVNQLYSQHRSNVKRDLRAGFAAGGATGSTLESRTDAAWDARSLNFRSEVPGIIGVADWFESYGRRHLSFQQTSQLFLTGSDGYRFNALGLWRSADGTISDATAARYDFRGSMWGSADIGFVYGHYMHLCSTDFIQRVRAMSMAALTAAYNVNAHPFVGDIDQFSQAQWLIRMTSFTSHAFNILRSETLLRARGVAVTVYATSNIQLGQWSNADAINLANDRIRLVETRLRSAGMVEYLSSYHGLAMQSLEQGMIHAPSRAAFLSLDAIYKLYHADLALNYHPASNSFPGPSGRSYDLFSGSRSVSDRFDLPMMMQWTQRPHCAQSLTQYSGTADGTVVGSFTPTALCSSNSLSVIPASGNLAEVIQRLYSAAWHAAGHLYAPLDLLTNVVQGSPYRTNEQRYSSATLQHRSNFISPYIEMGFSGENYVAVPVGIFATARLGGQATATPVVSDHNGRSNAVPYIRLMCELNDAPFSRAANPTVPGDAQQTLSRLVASQYQGFMLLSTFLTPQVGMTSVHANAPWQTTIIVPITVDAIWATTRTQNLRLPVTAGTAYALPTSTILTVRHQTQSVAMRLARAEVHTASRITTVSTIRSVAYPANGLEPYALMWLVDAASFALGVGRLVVHHKHRNIAALTSYRTAWVWQGGRTNSDAEMSRLQANLRATVVTESFSNTNWNPANQPIANAAPTGVRSASTWSLSATSGGVAVALRRSDVYEPFGSAAPYRDPATGSAFVAPFYVDNISRTVNGRQILQWASGAQPFRTIRHTNVWQPWIV